MKKDNLLKALIDSSLTIGNYKPTATFLSTPSVAVFAGEHPLITTGWSGDQESETMAQRLLCSPKFKHLAKTLGYTDELKVGPLPSQAFPRQSEYTAIIQSERGVMEKGGLGELIAIVLDTKNPQGLATACCITPELEKILSGGN